MRVQTEEWRRFVPGVRLYKGKKTLFYNGEKLWEGGQSINGQSLVYDRKERESWEVIIVLPGVEVIPEYTFHGCKNVEKVIMADTVTSIANEAFYYCTSLSYARLSRNLRFIGRAALRYCVSLTSLFVPPSCREVGIGALSGCTKLTILSVPNHTRLGPNVIEKTALNDKFPRGMRNYLFANRALRQVGDHVYGNDWIKDINEANEFALHRACSSFNPLEEIIHAIVKRQGLQSLKKKNGIGVTPLQYLETNPYTDIEEKEIMKQYILDIMGEIVV